MCVVECCGTRQVSVENVKVETNIGAVGLLPVD